MSVYQLCRGGMCHCFSFPIGGVCYWLGLRVLSTTLRANVIGSGGSWFMHLDSSPADLPSNCFAISLLGQAAQLLNQLLFYLPRCYWLSCLGEDMVTLARVLRSHLLYHDCWTELLLLGLTVLKMGRYYSTTMYLLLGYVVSILLSKLNNCPNTDTWLCYCNYPFLTVYSCQWLEFLLKPGNGYIFYQKRHVSGGQMPCLKNRTFWWCVTVAFALQPAYPQVFPWLNKNI